MRMSEINEVISPKTSWMEKESVIRFMIEKVKDNDWLMIAFILNDLRANGIGWPELDTFEKSVKKELSPTLWSLTLHGHHIVKDVGDDELFVIDDQSGLQVMTDALEPRFKITRNE